MQNRTLTSTRTPLVICSAVIVSSDRFMLAWSLYSSGCLQIHLLKLRAKAKGYCQPRRKKKRTISGTGGDPKNCTRHHFNSSKDLGFRPLRCIYLFMYLFLHSVSTAAHLICNQWLWLQFKKYATVKTPKHFQTIANNKTAKTNIQNSWTAWPVSNIL